MDIMSLMAGKPEPSSFSSITLEYLVLLDSQAFGTIVRAWNVSHLVMLKSVDHSVAVIFRLIILLVRCLLM